MLVSIIIPSLNEAPEINNTLQPLQELRKNGHQIILVDGGSHDGTISLAENLVDRCISSPPGRSRQMNKGATKAIHPGLLFLHADTRLPANAIAVMEQALQQKRWGRFNVTIAGNSRLLSIIAFFINLRSCISSIASGDQAIFVETKLFNEVGGFPNIPIMEDIALSRQLRSLQRSACIRAKVVTSGRRWQTHGICKTVLQMWLLRCAFFLGIKPSQLARFYAAK